MVSSQAHMFVPDQRAGKPQHVIRMNNTKWQRPHPIQTPFAKKLTRSEDCNHRFLALLGNDRELDLALLDVKNRVRDLSLRKNNLIISIFGYCFSFAHLGEKCFGIKRGFNSLPHKGSLFLSHKGGPFPRQRQGEAVGL